LTLNLGTEVGANAPIYKLKEEAAEEVTSKCSNPEVEVEELQSKQGPEAEDLLLEVEE